MNDIEVRINKEVRDYQEGIFFGLTLRQFLCAFGAVAVALAVYFFLGPALGGSDVGWACVLAAAPFALCGFYRYNHWQTCLLQRMNMGRGQKTRAPPFSRSHGAEGFRHGALGKRE